MYSLIYSCNKYFCNNFSVPGHFLGPENTITSNQSFSLLERDRQLQKKEKDGEEGRKGGQEREKRGEGRGGDKKGREGKRRELERKELGKTNVREQNKTI